MRSCARQMVAMLILLMLSEEVAFGIIPEPDKVLLGTITISNKAIAAKDGYRAHNVANYVVEVRTNLAGPALHSYQMGSLTNYHPYFYGIRKTTLEAYPARVASETLLLDTLYVVLLRDGAVISQKVYRTTDRAETRLDFGPVADSDNDGLPDLEEFDVRHTDPNNPDTDGDMVIDGREIRIYGTDPLVADTDRDGYSDGFEIANLTDPMNSNSLSAAISGRVDYSGEQTGSIWALASRLTNDNCVLTLNGAGGYVAITGLVYAAAGQLTGLTVEAWVNTTATGQNVVVSWDRSVAFRFTVGDDTLGGYSGRVGFDTTDQGGNTQDMMGYTPVNDGRWHHIASTYDPADGTKRVYVDGYLDNVQSNAHAAGLGLVSGTAARHGFIGVESMAAHFDGTHGAKNFEGSLDEIRIWHRALSASEIRSNLYTRLLGNEPGLQAAWNFEDAAQDVTTNGNRGYLRGSAILFAGPRYALSRESEIAAPGSYVVTNVPTLANYAAFAYRDSNGNHTQDYWEAWGDYSANPIWFTGNTTDVDMVLTDPDNDADGLFDYEELFTYGTNPFDTDSDDDGLTDYAEVTTWDTDPTEPDSDGDGLTDYQEVVTYVTDPNDPDTDHDAISDKYEVDYGLNPLVDDAAGDADNDCLSNLLEFQAGTSSLTNDTDGDGMWDGWEWTYSTNNPAHTNAFAIDPLDNGSVETNQTAASDPDLDGLSNIGEFQGWYSNAYLVAGCDASGPTRRASKDPTLFDSEVSNLALASRGSTITGSNGANWGELIDGVTTGYTGTTGFGYTYLENASNAPGNMTLDLKGLCVISSMKLLLWDLDNRYYQYKIEASNNNAAWTTIVDRTAATNQCRSRQDIAFDPPIQARYLRLTGTYDSSLNGNNNGFHVVEWQVYGVPPEPVILTSTNAVIVPIGVTATFQVKFNALVANPTTVTVSRLSGDTNIVVQSGGSLTFSASNWDAYQPVTLQAGPATPPNASAVFRSSALGIADAEVTATALNNLALASRGSTITGNNGANWGKLIDGVITGYTSIAGFGYTYWKNSINAPGSMTLDLKEMRAISMMKLLLWDLDNRCYQYKIETSSNNATWVTIVDRTAATNQCRSWQNIGFNPLIQARYLRLTGTYNSSDKAFHVVEWQVYDARLTETYTITPAAGTHGLIVPGTPVTLSAGQSTGFVVSAAADYYIASLTTNGAEARGVAGLCAYTSWWNNVRADGTLAAIFASVTNDTATNGTPVPWLRQYYTNEADLEALKRLANEDTDVDGMLTWKEYWSRTDPTDSNKFLHFTAIQGASGSTGSVVQWTSETDVVYRLTSSTNLLTDPFTTIVSTNIPATPPINVATDETAVGEAVLYYRIGVER